jgi:hypothetical protein
VGQRKASRRRELFLFLPLVLEKMSGGQGINMFGKSGCFLQYQSAVQCTDTAWKTEDATVEGRSKHLSFDSSCSLVWVDNWTNV